MAKDLKFATLVLLGYAVFKCFDRLMEFISERLGLLCFTKTSLPFIDRTPLDFWQRYTGSILVTTFAFIVVLLATAYIHQKLHKKP